MRARPARPSPAPATTRAAARSPTTAPRAGRRSAAATSRRYADNDTAGGCLPDRDWDQLHGQLTATQPPGAVQADRHRNPQRRHEPARGRQSECGRGGHHRRHVLVDQCLHVQRHLRAGRSGAGAWPVRRREPERALRSEPGPHRLRHRHWRAGLSRAELCLVAAGDQPRHCHSFPNNADEAAVRPRRRHRAGSEVASDYPGAGHAGSTATS